MKLVRIPPGTFRMGSPRDEQGRSDDEGQHEVEITHPFYMGVHEVTQEQYEKVMGTNPSYFSPTGGGKDRVRDVDTSRFPVESVSWEDAGAFCAKLSAVPEEKQAGRVYRLPTEAEWEYACREGGRVSGPFHFGSSLCSTQANFDGNHPYGGADRGPNLERPAPVGSYQANAFGLYDLHGNVWEWCADWYGWYNPKDRRDPQGPASGTIRVPRGGSWYNSGRNCRAARRARFPPGVGFAHTGFRVVLLPGTWTP
jgi:formylglycine-generating enzyme required for sulfatase activity